MSLYLETWLFIAEWLLQIRLPRDRWIIPLKLLLKLYNKRQRTFLPSLEPLPTLYMNKRNYPGYWAQKLAYYYEITLRDTTFYSFCCLDKRNDEDYPVLPRNGSLSRDSYYAWNTY